MREVWRACERRAARSARAPCVDAAGAWARLVAGGSAGAAGRAAPAISCLITEPDRRRRARVPDRPVDRRQRLRAARARRPHAGRVRGRPAPARGGDAAAVVRCMADLPLDIEVLWRLARSVQRAIPDLPGPDDPRGRAPRRAADAHHGRPLSRRAAARRGRRVGHERLLRRRLSVSPALGEAIAEWILDGRPSLDLAEISQRASPGSSPTRSSCASAAAAPTRPTHRAGAGDNLT